MSIEITADQARVLTEKSLNDKVNELLAQSEDMIKREARSGLSNVRVPLMMTFHLEEEISRVIEKLGVAGFTASFEAAPNERDTSWIDISW